MCTSVVEIVPAAGMARGSRGWFELTRAVVSYDHPHHALLEEAMCLDFVNPAEGPGARAAVEMTLDSARALHAALGRALADAEAMEAARGSHGVQAVHPGAPGR